eukprot:Gb_35461 [translate_table: standard]
MLLAPRILSDCKEGSNIQTLIKRFWKVAVPYWTSEDKVQARSRLAGVFALTLATTGISVGFNFLGRDFYNALASKDQEQFTKQLLYYLGAFAGGIPVSILLHSCRRQKWAPSAQQHTCNRYRTLKQGSKRTEAENGLQSSKDTLEDLPNRTANRSPDPRLEMREGKVDPKKTVAQEDSPTEGENLPKKFIDHRREGRQHLKRHKRMARNKLCEPKEKIGLSQEAIGCESHNLCRANPSRDASSFSWKFGNLGLLLAIVGSIIGHCARSNLVKMMGMKNVDDLFASLNFLISLGYGWPFGSRAVWRCIEYCSTITCLHCCTTTRTLGSSTSNPVHSWMIALEMVRMSGHVASIPTTEATLEFFAMLRDVMLLNFDVKCWNVLPSSFWLL